MALLFRRCCCFSIETGGMFIASWNAAIALFFTIFPFWMIANYLDEYNELFLLGNSVLFAVSAGVFCISLLCIKGIENRNHVFVMPMIIWLGIAAVLLAIFAIGALFHEFDKLGNFLTIVDIIVLVLYILSFVLMFSLYKLFRNEPRRGIQGLQNSPIINQQPLQQLLQPYEKV